MHNVTSCDPVRQSPDYILTYIVFTRHLWLRVVGNIPQINHSLSLRTKPVSHWSGELGQLKQRTGVSTLSRGKQYQFMRGVLDRSLWICRMTALALMTLHIIVYTAKPSTYGHPSPLLLSHIIAGLMTKKDCEDLDCWAELVSSLFLLMAQPHTDAQLRSRFDVVRT